MTHHIDVKPTIETVKRLEIGERAREEQRLLSRPNKHPRVKHDDEVSLYWSSDDDVEMFLDSSAGPSSRCAKIASPLDATDLFPSGYNAIHATIETTSIVPYVENIICCPNVISDFAAEDHMNRVDWFLDSGASLHFTGDCHDFHRFSPLFFLSPKRPLIQLRSTMTCFHIPYLILSHVPFLLSYLSSSFGHFG